MPKTPEEYEQEMKAMKANYEGQIAKQASDIAAKDEIIAKERKHAVELQTSLETFQKAERSALEERYHAVMKDLPEDQKKTIETRVGPLDKMSNKEVESFIAGFEVKHAANPYQNTPKTSNTTVPTGKKDPDPRSAGAKLLDS